MNNNSYINKQIRQSLKNEKFKEVEQNLNKDLIDNIKSIAKKKKIKLKMFIRQLNNLNTFRTKFERFAFMKAAILLQDLMDEDKLPVYIKNSYQNILGRNYITKGEPGFDSFHSYVEIIYEYRCLFDMGTITDIYIGHTEKKIQIRFEYEIESAFKNYRDLGELPSRLIEKAILSAIEKEISSNIINITGLEHETFSDLHQFVRTYLDLEKNHKFRIRKQIANYLLTKYIKPEILEKHFTKKEVNNREKWYKENYPDSYGTVYPYGLNMNSNVESTRKYVALPMYDIAFMLALGFRVPYISKLLKKLYRIKQASEDNVYNRIVQFFTSVENAENRLLKPVVQALLENFSDITGEQIGRIVHRKAGRQFMNSEKNSSFKRWFGEIKLRELKKAIALKTFNWNDIDHSIQEIKEGNYIKNIEKSDWKKFFIEGASNKKLAKLVGYMSPDSFRKHFFELEASKKAFGVSNTKAAIKKYRKLKSIEVLKNTLSPSILDFEILYTTLFGFKSRKQYIQKYKNHYDNGNYLFERSLTQYFKTLFDGMSLEEIIDYYGS